MAWTVSIRKSQSCCAGMDAGVFRILSSKPAHRVLLCEHRESMENDGTILGYKVMLRANALEDVVRGVLMIEIEGHVTDRVIRTLGGFPETSQIHTTNGRWDLLVELSAWNLTDFDAALRKVRLVPRI